MRRMIIMRGLPGAGKDTALQSIAPEGTVICSADDFFMEDGEYKFVPWKIGQAHEECKLKCFKALAAGKDVAISNTNVRGWEYEFYVLMGKHFGYEVEIHSVFDGGCSDEELFERNLHGVPQDVIARMRSDYEEC